MSIDRYMTRRHDPRTYNCAHFVCEVWSDLRNPEIANILRGFLCGPTKRIARKSDLYGVRLLDKPEDPCLVLMQRPRSPPHVGVWLRGRVLHLQEKVGVQYQPIEVVSIGFKKVRFFTC